jgi:hypothetical protein
MSTREEGLMIPRLPLLLLPQPHAKKNHVAVSVAVLDEVAPATITSAAPVKTMMVTTRQLPVAARNENGLPLNWVNFQSLELAENFANSSPDQKQLRHHQPVMPTPHPMPF